jgi:methylphosphotriester-DNA--protein-cysteine methyltransferase
VLKFSLCEKVLPLKRTSEKHVVGHCQYGRTNVSQTFQRRFGSFANYVNGLRLAYYDLYVEEHPAETKEAAALAAGFSSYNSYYRAKQKLERENG